MSEQWQVAGPKVIEVGGDEEPVLGLTVSIVGGRVDVLAHDPADGSGATVEVSEVSGSALTVRWDGRKLSIHQGADTWESLRRLVGGHSDRAVVSVSVPSTAATKVNTVSAAAVVSGLRADLRVNTVSGTLTVSDVVGSTSVNTVSGAAECSGLRGSAKLNTVSGGITMHTSEVPTAAVNTVSGEVVLDLLNGAADVSSSSVSGDVTIRLPFSGYAVRATSLSGQVVVDGQQLQRRSARDGASLREGDESLQLKTSSVSGNVVVLRRAEAAGPQDSVPYPQDAR